MASEDEKCVLHICNSPPKDSVGKIWYAPNRKQAYGDEEIQAVVQCLNDGWLAGFGEKTLAFERKVSEKFGKKYGVFLNSGSSACLLAVACLNLKKGTEIITPACTFSTTVAPIIQLGYKPIFCDIELNTYVPPVDAVIACVTERTSAIMLPNLIGNKPDWKGLKDALTVIGRGDIKLIEDSADTITNTVETDVSTTSFYASHIITAGGMGGMLMVNSIEHKNLALQYRDWGRIGDNSEKIDERFAHEVDGIKYDYKFLYGVMGYNFKCCEMCAAFGLIQLEKFEDYKHIRRENIERYLRNLEGVGDLVLPDDSLKPNWLAIPLQSSLRLELLTYLENHNIQTRVTFAGNVTRHPVYRAFYKPFANSDTVMANGFLLGAHHGMGIKEVDYVCDQIKAFFAQATQ
jgi:CDP-4-dehydro-6-deoxyglucose reductase, E1